MKICGSSEIIDNVYHIREKTRMGDVLHKTDITVESVTKAREHLNELKKILRMLDKEYIQLSEYDWDSFNKKWA